MAKALEDMTLDELWELFPIVLEPHNDVWAEWFSDEAAILRDLCPEAVISDIGSTAVPGIMAKPTVDILLEFKTKDEMVAAASRMVDAGYLKMSESESRISLNKGYTPEGYADRVFHLHLRLSGDNAEIRFRDYLTAHPEAAGEYESLKAGLAGRFRKDRDAYTAGKTEFVENILRRL